MRAAVAEDSAAGWTDVGMGKQLLLIGAGDFANELALRDLGVPPMTVDGSY